MTAREWVENWFDGARYGVDLMTEEEAENDLQNFRADGLEIPEGLTAQEYMEIWNELCAAYVVNEDGKAIRYDVAVEMMDDELREEIHSEISPCTDQEFFDEYVRRHREKFGEEFTV